jgi:exonuclease SbcC
MGIYDQIMRRANAEASTQQSRADFLDQQLGRYADATPEVQDRAAARVDELSGLAARVEVAMPEITSADTQLSAAKALVEQLTRERTVLAAVSAPDKIASLDQRRRTANTTLDDAHRAADDAERARIQAQENLAAAPDRAHLEHVRRDHAEHRDLTDALPTLRERRARADNDLAEAVCSVRDSEEAAERVRVCADLAAAALATARQTTERLDAEVAALRQTAVPAGLGDLADRLARATSALAEHRATTDAAETADAQARAAASTGPERAVLEQLHRDHLGLLSARVAADKAAGDWEAAQKAAEAAGHAADEAQQQLDELRASLNQAERLDLAAALRPQLTEGADCPVCAQTVLTLPPPLATADLDDIRRAVANGEAASRTAMQQRATADAATETAVETSYRAIAAVTELEAALAGRPSGVQALQGLAELDRLSRVADDAAAAARSARHQRDRAAELVDDLRRALASAEADLRQARDPLVPLGAPAPGDDVRTSWRALVDWACEEAAVRDAQLSAQQAAVAEAECEATNAQVALAATRKDASLARDAEATATRTQQRAITEIENAERRMRVLAESLAAEPDDATAAAEIARALQLADAARREDLAARTVRDALRDAETAARTVDKEISCAWQELRSARDPLVGLGAPELTSEDLTQAWAILTGWAVTAAGERTTRCEHATASASRAEEHRLTLEARIAAAFAQCGLSVEGDIARIAPTQVAAALYEARSTLNRVIERRAEAAALVAERDEATSAHQVAKLLGEQLRSNNFPRWLVASALDVLVADASESLLELSGGQFELTHDNGDFVVVDHADADARRPVKTLSGGETFQASLALALALSSQLAGLASEGAPRLESIFLDEGFGTLDEANLETVANTLENLATRGDRMVGVITHVPALAERIPVRFSLSRDQRTSTIVREGL